MSEHARLEPIGKVRTKVVATLGPASRSTEMIGKLIEAGVDCFRLNASHSPREQRAETLKWIRAVADERDRPVAVLLDLGGPKIRLGRIVGDTVDCPLDGLFRLALANEAGLAHVFTCTCPEILEDLDIGDEVLFSDGTVGMRVTSKEPDGVTLVVTLPGRLRSGQGVNLPGATLRVAALTDNDLADVAWTRDHPVDYVGLSFARSAADVRLLRDELAKCGSTARIITKIEKPQAVSNLDAIIEETDAIMVARGDLGVEMDVALVPAIQKRIIAACHRARVPVITATQMLTSMEHSNRPTRAEASDVFNAVLDGTDAVMLSGETAIGEYPIETVRMMSRIAGEAESIVTHHWRDPGPITRSGWITPTTEAIVEAACAACRKLEARLLVVATHSGRTALAVAKQRRLTPTLALTDNTQIARAMSLYWGVTPLCVEKLSSLENALEFALGWARDHELAASGDTVVMIRGTVPGSRVHNALVVEQLR